MKTIGAVVKDKDRRRGELDFSQCFVSSLHSMQVLEK